MKPSLVVVGLTLLTFFSNAAFAFAAAPFSDSFDTYQSGNVYAQGLWQNKAHVWDVQTDGCYAEKCIASTGVNDATWKVGSSTAAGTWSLRFKVTGTLGRYDFGTNVYIGAVGGAQGGVHIGSNSMGAEVLDPNANALVSSLDLNAWHTLEFSWDFSNPSNCSFTVRIDGSVPVNFLPWGNPTNCFNGYFSGSTVNEMTLSNYYAGAGSVLIDDIEGGPVLAGCLVNCDGTVKSQIIDSFDTFNDKGWSTRPTPYSSLILFTPESAGSGNCHSGSCVVGNGSLGGLGTGSTAPYMYLESGVGSSSGAFTIWAKTRSGWSHVVANIGICASPWSECVGQNSMYSFNDVAPNDNVWHQYYIAWRQGSSHVETCLLQDSSDTSTCTWSDTGIPLGTQFDGVLLSGFAPRSDLGDNLWFDDLTEARSVQTACIKDCYSNVLFLPGIESSRLYRSSGGNETKLWEPGGNDTVTNQLAMYPEGNSVNADVYTRDVIDLFQFGPIGALDIYGSFEKYLNTLKSSGTIKDWAAAPYDWRLTLEGVVNSGVVNGGAISYLQSTEQPYIINRLKDLASTSKTGKVTIVAHSNGGLVTKALMQKLGSDAAKYVDKIIFVAVPQLGTPEAIAELLHGHDAGIALLLSNAEARSLSQNMPMTYTLLPSSSYFSTVGTPVITFSTSTLSDWVTKYGGTISTSFGLGNFIDDTSRPQPNFSDLSHPTVANAALFSQSQTMHDRLDSWVPPADVQLYEIAGSGDETLSNITYRNEMVRTCLQRNLIGQCINYGVTPKLTTDIHTTLNGDGTVVEPSALWSGGTPVTRYWVDLGKYNAFPNLCRFPFCKDHKNILSIPQVVTLIGNIFTTSTSTSDYISTTPFKYTVSKRLHFTLHSPLTLEFYDAQGNHEGFSATTNTTEYNVPGAELEQYGDVEWLSVPKDMAGTLVLHGIGSGSFTLDIEEVDGDTVTATTSFAAIPSATTTVATMAIDPSFSPTATGTLIVDEYGDGSQIMNLVPRLDTATTLYQFDGFLQPINDTAHQIGQSMSVFKAGSTIPVKLQLKNLNGVVVQAAVAPQWLAPQRLGVLGVSTNETTTVVAGTTGNMYAWDSVGQQYTYNWNTKGLTAGYWYKVYAKLDDGTTQWVIIGLK